MNDFLKDHPELAPDIFKLVSNKLSVAQEEIKRLEEAAAQVARDDDAVRSAEAKVAKIQVLYERERESRKQILQTLEGQWIKLRTAESALDADRQDIAGKIEKYKQQNEALEEHCVEVRAKEATVADDRRTLEGQIEAFSKRTETLEARYKALRAAEAAAEKRRSEIDEETEVLRQNTEALEDRSVELRAKERIIDNDQKDLKETMEVFHRKNETLEERYLALRAEETDLDEKAEALRQKTEALESQSVELRTKEAAERRNLEEQTEGLRRKTETLEGRYVALRAEESAAANGKRELAEQTEALRQKAEAFDERDLELQRKEGLLIKAQRSVDGAMENFQNKAAILKEQYIQMRLREEAFAKYRQSVQEWMDKFEQDPEKLFVDAKAKAKDLQTQLGEAIEENAALHRTLEERNLEISENKDAISSLFQAKQMLEQNLRALQAQPGHTQELEQRRAKENALRAELSDFSKRFDANKAELEALQKKLETSEADATVTSAAHARAEDDMRGLRAEKAETDQRLRAKELELTATSVRESELLAALDAERMRAAADQKQSEEKIVMLQAELEALTPATAKFRHSRVLRFEFHLGCAEIWQSPVCLQTEVSDADRRTTEYEAAKGALEARVATLRTQRKQSDSKVSELEEELRAAAKASDNSISKLRDNLKQRMLQISELKKKIEQHNTKAKAEALKLSEIEATQVELTQQYHDLDSAYTHLQQEFEAQTVLTDLIASDPEINGEVQALQKKNQSLVEMNTTLREVNGKLEEKTKNLQGSILRAGAEVKQELQKAADVERNELETKNARLKQDLETLKQNFLVVIADRKILAERLDRLFKSSADKSYSAEGSHPSSARRETAEPNSSVKQEEKQTETGDRKPDAPTERMLYAQFMGNFDFPRDRIEFKDLKPIHVISKQSFEPFAHNMPASRPSLHCPKRTIWCGPNQRQALVFAPTHEYLPSAEQWTRHSKMAAACGSTFDFFVNQGTFVYYVGTYKVHSLRSIHPPGSPVPSDISYAAIRHAMGLGAELQTKIRQYFPDGNVKTECFGLQCVGFDHQLYGRLRDRFLAQEARDSASLKRKADSEGPRDGSAKLQRVL